MKLLIVGQRTDSHIGGSLERAALREGHSVELADVSAASRGNRLVRSLYWRIGRRPPRLKAFTRSVLERIEQFRPDLLLATGLAPLTAEGLRTVRQMGTRCVNYLTDDPWNPAFRADWVLASLASYDAVFSPRRSNLHDLMQLRGPVVQYLPFAYDADLFRPAPPAALEHDVFFAGNADGDRYPIMRALAGAGFSLALCGHNWNRYPGMGRHWLGPVPPAQLPQLVASSALSLCLVRRANRDGHSMRTFELPAMAACILAERTTEHEEIYGDTVTYFEHTAALIHATGSMLRHSDRRADCARPAHERITTGPNTYADRVRTMMGAVP